MLLRRREAGLRQRTCIWEALVQQLRAARLVLERLPDDELVLWQVEDLEQQRRGDGGAIGAVPGHPRVVSCTGNTLRWSMCLRLLNLTVLKKRYPGSHDARPRLADRTIFDCV